jgi:voltage-gated potassium channel
MLEKLKYRVYDVLIETDDNELVDRIVATFLMILILINAGAVVLESVDEYQQQFAAVFNTLETFSVAVFTLEYVLRLWVITYVPRFAKPVTGRMRYALTPMALIDLLAILPAYLPLFFGTDLRLVRMLRIFRLFRLLKLNRYIVALNTLDDVVKSKREELVTIFVMILTMLFFSASLMYVLESEAQPDKFQSIPAAMWWAVATLTTVGYGDVYPVTPLGKLLGAVIAFLGVGIFALPAGILASGFAEEIRKNRALKEEKCCPHCGREYEKNNAEARTK